MSFEITGRLHKKFDTENKTDSFQAREFVIVVDNSGYTNYIKFQLVQDKCGLIDSYEEGQDIKVHFDLRGREWNEKYFTNLNAWRIEAPEAQATKTATPPTAESFPAAENEPPAAEVDDDLPF